MIRVGFFQSTTFNHPQISLLSTTSPQMGYDRLADLEQIGFLRFPTYGARRSAWILVGPWNGKPSGGCRPFKARSSMLGAFLHHIHRQIPGPAIASSLFQASFRMDPFTADITRRVQPLDRRA
jgi:hypothetical protein